MSDVEHIELGTRAVRLEMLRSKSQLMDIGISQQELDSLNIAQERETNKRNLASMGGVDGLIKERLHVDITTGLMENQVICIRQFSSNKISACNCLL